MNTPLRRVGLAMLGMVILLLANVTYIQIFKADDYRKNINNKRIALEEYSRERGKILVRSGDNPEILATVQATNDRLRYLRQYTNGPLYAPVTGFYSTRYGAGGLEKAEDEILNGSDDRLFVRRLSDLITGRDPRGGNVELTINPAAQTAAYQAMESNGFKGAVVALNPKTGEILTMVSTPSYDPNPLSAHDGDAQEQAWNGYNKDNPAKPMLNRAIAESYPPGSTFKLVVAAAALEDGRTKDDPVTSTDRIAVGGSELRNYNRGFCDNNRDSVSMTTALALSCNTAFAQLAHDLGDEKFLEQAEKFGIGEDNLTVPMPVVQSCVGPKPDECMSLSDSNAIYQSAIGQRDVRLTPLQNAEIVATIANGGERMRPQLVKSILAPDLSKISDFDTDSLGDAMSRSSAEQLRDMMVESEAKTGGAGKRGDLVIASKTGTAETGNDPKNTPPFAWYVAFAPANDPKVAVAVVVESKDVAATGGKLSAAVGRATINAALAGGS
ncbi:Cell division protein FtsI [Actinokineospora spheciospongiae]|uniref:Cell division protein FtsI n=1 Tax=Actinokineospora spheciospongiae TaxID=909613 RepID=W7IP51_9PSEU|nr:penicillin-binding protein 2 [Actinokineospora spheciospongiae]EWC58341.1 Cell division protein FtsI [Actinokineospora spheciospongiae]PWW61979.1 peptidoglycan glycosyltransferase [Actinokineospora spheciospongiae]